MTDHPAILRYWAARFRSEGMTMATDLEDAAGELEEMQNRLETSKAAYERAHWQYIDALNEAARLKRKRDEQKRRADALEWELSDTKKEITDLEDERNKTLVMLAHTDIGSLPNNWTLQQVAEARIDDLLKLRDQVRDTCRRAERAEWAVTNMAAVLNDHPAAGEQATTSLRVSSGSDGVLFRLGNGCAFEVHANDLDGLLDDIESVRDGGYLDTGITVAIRQGDNDAK